MRSAQGAGDPAHQPTMPCHQIGKVSPALTAISVQRHEGDALKRNTALPSVADLGKGAPGLERLACMAVQMGSDRSDAMRLGAGKAEGHATDQVVAAPIATRSCVVASRAPG